MMHLYQYVSHLVYSACDYGSFDNATNTILVICDLALVSFALSLVRGDKKSGWSGSRMSASVSFRNFFVTSGYAVWRPYFKKDGYFGLFFETTLWA